MTGTTIYVILLKYTCVKHFHTYACIHLMHYSLAVILDNSRYIGTKSTHDPYIMFSVRTFLNALPL